MNDCKGILLYEANIYKTFLKEAICLKNFGGLFPIIKLNLF